MKTNQLNKLYISELRDLFSAESQLLVALPKMAKAATSPDLSAGFEGHLKQTKGHLIRLEEIFLALKENPKGKHCKGMEGLIKEGEDLIASGPSPEELDAGLIAAAQHVEHYEIAGYGCVRTYAELLGEPEAAKLLQETLDEEKQTDLKLTKLAEKINVEAMDASTQADTKKVQGSDKIGRQSATA